MKLQMIFRLLLPEPMVYFSQKQQISGHRTRSVLEQYNVVKDIDLRLAAQEQAEYLEAQSRIWAQKRTHRKPIGPLN